MSKPTKPDNTEAKRILKLLNYDPNTASEEMKRCLEIGDKLDDAGKSRAAAMVKNDKLRKWLTEDAFSSSLLVHGHCDLEGAEGPSPFSFVDAQLASNFAKSEHAFVVAYFCGMYKDTTRSSQSSPLSKMMSSLNGQLMSQMLKRKLAVDTSFLNEDNIKNIERLKLETLCILFRELTLQLPLGTILFCVLDELSLYETAALAKETDAVVRRLDRLVHKHTDVKFKLLITCRGRSLGFHKHFDSSAVLDLAEDVEEDDYALWKVRNVR